MALEDAFQLDYRCNPSQKRLDHMHSKILDTIWIRKYLDAIFLFMAIGQFEKMGLHLGIEIGREISDEDLKQYDEYVHEYLFPPKDPSSVKEAAGDGHQKVVQKCHSNQQNKPKTGPKIVKRDKRMKSDTFTNGWFMVTEPSSQRILSVQLQKTPENNEVKGRALSRIVSLYKNLDLFIHDRACGFEKYARKQNELKQFKYYVVDRFHGKNHTMTLLKIGLFLREKKEMLV